MNKLHKSSVSVFSDYILEICRVLHNQKVLNIYYDFNTRNSVNRINDILNYSVYKIFNEKE